MPRKQHIGYINTFSPGLGSGSVEVTLDGARVSLPFRSKVVEGSRTQLRSGDRVQVTLARAGDPKRREVLRIEAAPAEAGPAGSAAREEDPDETVKSSARDDLEQIRVLRDGETMARFTKEKFMRSGSRLDFG